MDTNNVKLPEALPVAGHVSANGDVAMHGVVLHATHHAPPGAPPSCDVDKYVLQQEHEHFDDNPNDLFAEADWEHSLFTCFADCGSCAESWICFRCQLSRQFNMTLGDGSPEVNWPVCLGTLAGDLLFNGVASAILQCVVRRATRRRFGISGTDCGDLCTVIWCGGCALQQSLLEMTNKGMHPGAYLYEAPRAVRMR